MKIDTIKEEINLLYHAVANPSYLADFLELVRKKTDSSNGTLQVDDYRTMEVVQGVFQGFSAHSVEIYKAYFSKINVFTNAIVNDYCRQDHIYVSDQLMPLKQFRRSEFYADWIAPHTGTDYSVWMTLNDNPQRVTKLTLQRQRGAESYSQDSCLHYLNLLQPHFKAAVQVLQHVEYQNTQSLALDHIDKAALLLDQKFQIVKSNRQFKVLAESLPNLTLPAQERLLLSEKCEQFLKACISAQSHLVELPNKGCSYLQTSENCTLLLRATPYVGQSGSILLFNEPQPLLLVTLESCQRSLNPKTLASLFQLTPAETQIVTLLFAGFSVAQISLKRGNTLSTVRSSLKVIFQKCGVNRQAQLLAKIAASPAYR